MASQTQVILHSAARERQLCGNIGRGLVLKPAHHIYDTTLTRQTLYAGHLDAADFVRVHLRLVLAGYAVLVLAHIGGLLGTAVATAEMIDDQIGCHPVYERHHRIGDDGLGGLKQTQPRILSDILRVGTVAHTRLYIGYDAGIVLAIAHADD